MSIGKVSRIIDKSGTKADIVDLENYAIPIYCAANDIGEDNRNFQCIANTEAIKYNYFPNGYNGGLRQWVLDYYNKFKKAPKFEIHFTAGYVDEEEFVPYESYYGQSSSFWAFDVSNEDSGYSGKIKIVMADKIEGVEPDFSNGDDPVRDEEWILFSLSIPKPRSLNEEASTAITIHYNKQRTKFTTSGSSLTISEIKALDSKVVYDELEPIGRPENFYADDSITLPPIPTDTEEE